jgi:hypothetical protein
MVLISFSFLEELSFVVLECFRYIMERNSRYSFNFFKLLEDFFLNLVEIFLAVLILHLLDRHMKEVLLLVKMEERIVYGDWPV